MKREQRRYRFAESNCVMCCDIAVSVRDGDKNNKEWIRKGEEEGLLN